MLVDIPKDVRRRRAPSPGRRCSTCRATTRPPARTASRSARPQLIASRQAARCSTSAAACSRPRAAAELRVLAELTGIPVVTTLMARGAFPDSHPQHLGMPGMHGTVAAVTALQKSDLLICLGARFDDRVTGKLDAFAPGAAVIHADIDPAEIGKNRAADVPIVGDCRETIADLRRRGAGGATPPARAPTSTPWWQQCDGWRSTLPAGLRGAGGRRPRPAVRHRADRQDRRTRGDHRQRRRPAPDVGRAVHLLREPLRLAQLRRRRDHGLRRARGDGRQGRPARRARSGRSTATAASR